jgi:hypothetical protein
VISARKRSGSGLKTAKKGGGALPIILAVSKNMFLCSVLKVRVSFFLDFFDWNWLRSIKGGMKIERKHNFSCFPLRSQHLARCLHIVKQGTKEISDAIGDNNKTIRGSNTTQKHIF